MPTLADIVQQIKAAQGQIAQLKKELGTGETLGRIKRNSLKNRIKYYEERLADLRFKLANTDRVFPKSPIE